MYLGVREMMIMNEVRRITEVCKALGNPSFCSGKVGLD